LTGTIVNITAILALHVPGQTIGPAIVGYRRLEPAVLGWVSKLPDFK